MGALSLTTLDPGSNVATLDDAPSWRLTDEHATITQGLVVSPFAHLPESRALLLKLPDAGGGAWLKNLRAACPITNATGAATPASAIAFTWTGLKAMGLDGAALATFSQPFQEGMHQADRQRRLSDLPDAGTVIDGGAQWCGNTPDTVVAAHTSPEAAQAIAASRARAAELTVHVLLLLFAADTGSLETFSAAVEQVLHQDGLTIQRSLLLSLRFDDQMRAREHFGFADGISQPVPEGDAITSSAGTKLPHDPLHGIAAGDVLMGHVNAQNEAAPGPMVACDLDADRLLPQEGVPPGFANLGLDGSYLVARELRQDVAAFWNSMAAASGSKSPPDAIWLAERVVGRTMDGDLLVPGGTLPPAPTASSGPRNDFTFFASDPHGLGCPVGAHVRRANPRDGLAPDKGSTDTLLQAAQNHRLLRRGRKFGPTIANPLVDDGAERGLLFMCLNTDLVRQFEFVQQTWLLNQNFGALLNETDPLLGPRGRFTIPTEPLRLRPVVETFVKFAGGEYFFLPSIPALDYLQTLPAPATPVAGNAAA